MLGLRQIAELEITSPVIQHSQKAIQSLEKIEALDSELLQTMQMGVTYLEQDLPTLALDYFQTTLDKEPNYHSAHYYLGYTYFLTGDISRALQYLEASLELGSPPDALAYYYLAKVYSHQKDYKKAINMYERSVDAGADFVDLFVSLGQALRENQEFSKAARSYLRALRLDENLIKTRVSLISIYLYNLKDYTKAKEIATECTKRDPLLARCHDLLGWVLLENEELIEAEKSIRLALELDPELASAYYNLATLLEQKGLIDQARTNYQTALDLDFTGEIAPIADQALANLP
ncbi:MAG TPA: tetratricopeptide repeat protein [Candidatus Wirthbacteria bacterium]|nr:tetratricopeptide repeat protein [Candidatus Wirthbacteria bacterium]